MAAAKMGFQMQLIPPFRYAIVEESFYRGAYPTLKNFRFLRRLHLKTIVSLTPEQQPNTDLCEFCQNEDITIRHFHVRKFQEVVTLTAAKVIQILELIICRDNLPLYLHCLDGARVTGLVVMCFRKLQCWNLSTSTAEFCRFQRGGEISREESQFVESFRGDINVPAAIPNWLWQGMRTVKHPIFRLHFLPSPTQAEDRHVMDRVVGFPGFSATSFQPTVDLFRVQSDCNKRHRMVCSKSEKEIHLLGTNCQSAATEKDPLVQVTCIEDQDFHLKRVDHRKGGLINLWNEGVCKGKALLKPEVQDTCGSQKVATLDSDAGLHSHQIECRKLYMEALSLEGLNLVRWKLQMPPLPKRPCQVLCIHNDGKVNYLHEGRLL